MTVSRRYWNLCIREIVKFLIDNEVMKFDNLVVAEEIVIIALLTSNIVVVIGTGTITSRELRSYLDRITLLLEFMHSLNRVFLFGSRIMSELKLI